MKNNKLIYLSLLSILLSSCQNGVSNTNDYQAIINSMKGVSHTADIDYKIYVNQVDVDSLDTYVNHVSTRTYSYLSNGERAYKIKSVMYGGDLIKGTHDLPKDSSGNDIVSTYDNGERLYFRDEETGVVLSEVLEINNTVSSYIQSTYDYTYGIYTPVIFDEEFRNPFDYIQSRDLQKIDETTYRLSKDKAMFALECYGSNAAMAVEDATITVNGNQVTALNFVMGIEGGEGYTYTRATSFAIKYSKFGEESMLQHITPYHYDNPALAQALSSLSRVKSYEYTKDYFDENGVQKDHIKAYVTEDAAFYHHHDDADDTEVYNVGDDYDYIAVKCDANKKYYGFEYSYNSAHEAYEPSLIMLSVSAAYSIDNFLGLGPNFGIIAPELFKLKEGTTNTYIIEDNTLRTSIASYFDYQFLGVNSQILETRTSKFEIVLDEDGSFTVNTGYAYSESGHMQKMDVVFHLDTSSFNKTTIPNYVTIPDTTGCENW